MADFEQRTIEHFFQQYNVTDQGTKEKLLTEVTDLIYDYNMLVVRYEKETDEYRRQQLRTDIEETLAKIGERFSAATAPHAA